MKPFRFGVALSTLPRNGWAERLRQIEAHGYSTVLWPDHFRTQWEPMTALAAAAAVTNRLHLGSLVCNVDHRHPVLLAKAAATIHQLSGFRHELGLGAGWMKSDYVQSGIPYSPARVRIERLDEALTIIRSVWTERYTSFSGKHFSVKEVPRAVDLPDGERPRIMVGGGGPRVLRVAARHADIVGICPSFREGVFTAGNIRDTFPERVREKVEWVREFAEADGKDPEGIEFSSQVFGLDFTEEPRPVLEDIAKRWGASAEEVEQCGLFLTGAPQDIRRKLESYRRHTGISYIVIPGSNPDVLAQFSEAVARPLAET